MTKLTRFLFSFLMLLPAFGVKGQAQTPFLLGSDLSYANMMEDCGAVFREDGAPKDVFKIFADNGTNLIRIRVWHNPNWQESLVQPAGVKPQYNNFDDARKAIARAKQAGVPVMLDIHYSDFWCDPAKQIVPQAWKNIASNVEILKDSVYNYTTKLLTTLNAEGLMPEYVKVGNENNGGILSQSQLTANYEASGSISTSWARHAQLFNAAIKAVRDVAATTTIKPKIALHVADHSKADWFYNTLTTNGVTDFDIMGFTYYVSYHGGTITDVANVIKSLKAKYKKDAMVVETGYLWDSQNIDQLGNIITKADNNYLPIGASNQQKYLVDLSKAVQNAGGLGIIFWEPAWVSTPCRTPWGQGSSHEHVTFFDHRNQLNYMKHGGGGWPYAFANNVTPEQINVTFKVDMTGVDTSNGVFITGNFTGSGNWQIVAMTAEGNNIFSYTQTMAPGESGAYYFLNKNQWGVRETVPAECAKRWDSDREYIVPEHDTIIGHKWGSCEALITSSQILKTGSRGAKVYPNPFNGQQLQVEWQTDGQASSTVNIFNAMGQAVYAGELVDNRLEIDRSILKRGVYFIQFSIENQVFVEKLIVE